MRSSSYEKSKTLGEESDTFHPAQVRACLDGGVQESFRHHQVVWLVLRGVYARLARQVGESHVGGTSGRKKKSKVSRQRTNSEHLRMQGAISGKKSAPTNRPSGSSTTPTAPKGGRKTYEELIVGQVQNVDVVCRRMSPREKSRRVGKASVTTSPRPTGEHVGGILSTFHPRCQGATVMLFSILASQKPSSVEECISHVLLVEKRSCIRRTPQVQDAE